MIKRLICALVLVLSASGQNSGYPASNLTAAYGVDTGTSNLLVVQLNPCPPSLAAMKGATIAVLPANPTTSTTPSLNVCGFGAHTITKLQGTAPLISGDIGTNNAQLSWNGTTFDLTNPISTSAVQPQYILASSYGVTGEGHFSFSSVTTSAPTTTVTCTICHYLTNATVGQIFYMSNLPTNGFSASSQIISAAATTITVINSDTQITLSGSVSANCAIGACMAVWGTDESTALTNAWNAALAGCATLQLPGINPEGSGPALILVSSGQFQGTLNDCGQRGTGNARSAASVYGAGASSTYIMPTPAFNASTCSSGISAKACFAGNNDGGDYCCFTIHGGGNANPGAALQPKVGFEIDSKNNAKAWDINLLFWGAGGGGASTSLGIGLLIDGGEIETRHVEVDGMGFVGRKLVSNASSAGPVVEYFPTVYDNGGPGVYENNGVNEYFTFGANYGAFTPPACLNNGAIWISNGDEFGLSAASGAGSGGINQIVIGSCTDSSGTVTGAATMRITNGLLYSVTSAGAHVLDLIGSTDVVHIANTLVVGRGTSGGAVIINNGVLYDDGGNSFQPGAETLYSGTGQIIGPVLQLIPESLAQTFTNDGSTGTTSGLIVKLSANDTVVTVGTSDVEAVGICLAACGTTGSSQVAFAGTAPCTFDNASTVGHYVQISNTVTAGTGVAGNCHDVGSGVPNTGGVIIGRVADGGSAGSHNVNIAVTPSGGSGATYSNVSINGGSAQPTVNLNGSTPSAPAGDLNVAFQISGSSVSAYIPPFGISGGSHAPGLVPDPGASAGTTHFLREDGTWQIPSTAGGATWDTLGGALANVTIANANFTTIFTQTSAVQWYWQNITAATNLGINAASPILGVCGTYFTLGASAADCWNLQDVVAAGTTSATVTNISETSGNVVTLTITGGTLVAGQVATFTGLTQGTWLNSQNATLTTASSTSLTFTDPTSHGTQASHAEAGQVTQANPQSTLNLGHTGSAGITSVAAPNCTLGSGGMYGFTWASSSVSMCAASAGSIVSITGNALYPSIRFYNSGTLEAALTNSFASPQTLTTLDSHVNGGQIIIAGLTETNNQQPSVIIGADGGNTAGYTGTTSGTQLGVTIGNGTFTGAGSLWFAPTSGPTNFTAFQVWPVIDQLSTSSGAYTGLSINVVETAVKATVTANKLLDMFSGSAGTTERAYFDSVGNENAPSFSSIGTAFTTNAGCSETSISAGATAGQFAAGTTGTCGTTITWGNTATSVHHWTCTVYDQTTKVAGFVTSSTTTTATISVVTTSGDIVVVGPCEGY